MRVVVPVQGGKLMKRSRRGHSKEPRVEKNEVQKVRHLPFSDVELIVIGKI